jgi:hypothetical protein
MDQAASPRDDVPTLMAAGALAYMAETLLHEAVGHGGVCVASGLRFTMLAPLWMRCSDSPLLLVAAGPAMNVLAACAFAAALVLGPVRRPLTALLLWLGFTFNALVACGYLAVGALAGFGDWPVVFASVQPQWAWRIPAAMLAVMAYYLCLRAAAALFVRHAGAGAAARARLQRRALWPTSAAAVVACLAEIAGGRGQPMPLALAVGCTILVGFSLTSMDTVVARPAARQRDLGAIDRAWWLIAGGLGASVAFIVLIGPGLVISH